MRKAEQASYTGKAGEYIVAGQLMLRGEKILWPSVDVGYDLMTREGCRIQVKTSHLYAAKETPRYFFPLKDKRNLFSAVCDYVVFYGIEQNKFWIVPASLVDSCTGVELGYEPSLRRFTGSIKDMREMISLGFSRGKVAKHYGIARTSLQQFLDSGKDFVDETVVSKMRACEGRWEYILDFARPLVATEAPAKQVGEE